MNLDYSEEQRYLQEEAHRFLDAQKPLARARKVFEGSDDFDVELWEAVAGQGWLGIDVGEEHGGVGLGVVEVAALAEIVGSALAPIPFASTVYGFSRAIAEFGSPEQQNQWLPRIASGEVIGSLAFFEGAGPLSADSIHTQFENGCLFGTKRPVDYAPIATHFLALASGADGPILCIAESKVTEIERLQALDLSIPIGAVHFDRAQAEPLGNADSESWIHLLATVATLTAFEQVAIADRCLAVTCDYTRHREAFGGPIGRFQAVKHKLADIYTANQIARSHAYGAVSALQSGSERLLVAAAGARIAASDATWLATKEMMHLHGGIGYTWEHDAHLFYRRAHHLSANLGAPDWWKEHLYATMRQTA